MNSKLENTGYDRPNYYKLSFLFCTFFFLFMASIFAQQIGIHAIKDLSNNSVSHKAWGVGGSIDLDQWVKKTTFRINFDWTIFRNKNDEIHPNYQRISGGISAFYSYKISKKFTFQCGAEISYSNLKYSYIYNYEVIINQTDTIGSRAQTLQHTGDFVGIGAHLGLSYELSPRFNLALSLTPTYLISVSSKSSVFAIEPIYSKNIWLFPLKLALSYKLFNSEQ